MFEIFDQCGTLSKEFNCPYHTYCLTNVAVQDEFHDAMLKMVALSGSRVFDVRVYAVHGKISNSDALSLGRRHVWFGSAAVTCGAWTFWCGRLAGGGGGRAVCWWW